MEIDIPIELSVKSIYKHSLIQLGMTQSDLAEILRVSLIFINLVISGRKSLPKVHFDKLPIEIRILLLKLQLNNIEKECSDIINKINEFEL